ncbi:CapA family protein [Brevibacterium sp. CT2-23B]|uniref:CapA family protein n=1 Tax=Brevibacterium sp. CT2-23B TaxID=2729630 RepID=UPI00155270BA|nr:CapA family protein [Brevibacterium sp. CT2-23B]
MKKKITVTGDSIVMRRGLRTNLPGSNDLYELVQDSDVAFTNLECLPGNFVGYPTKESGGAHFGCRDEMLDELTDFGFNLFSAANNHSLNYGVTGLLEVIKQMRGRNLAFSGVGEHLDRAQQPAYLDTANGSVGLLSYSATFASGHEASAQRPDLQGRPGLNPIAFETRYELDDDSYSALRRIAEDLGLEDRRRREIKLGFEFPPADPADLPFLGGTFIPSTRNCITTRCTPESLENLERWVIETKRRSDVVIVSIHSHEQGDDLTDPAEFTIEFARKAIEFGADVVVGHGPHFLRPLEIYRGKPIFYSLGNFIGQNELVEQLPSDSYKTFRIPGSNTPSQIFDARTELDTKGFPSEGWYWRTVIPVLSYDEEDLVTIEIYPVTLDLGQKPQTRGRPRIAQGEEGTSILQDFLELSERWGSGIFGGISDGRLTIRPAEVESSHADTDFLAAR